MSNRIILGKIKNPRNEKLLLQRADLECPSEHPGRHPGREFLARLYNETWDKCPKCKDITMHNDLTCNMLCDLTDGQYADYMAGFQSFTCPVCGLKSDKCVDMTPQLVELEEYATDMTEEEIEDILNDDDDEN